MDILDLKRLKDQGKIINFVDIDGTICTDTFGKYKDAKPLKERIEKFNKLYNDGEIVIYYTARGSFLSGDWKTITERQLKEWGVKYHDIWFNKPYYDRIFDNRSFNIDRMTGKKCETCQLRYEYDRPGFMWDSICRGCDSSCFYEEDDDETTE